MFKKLLVMVSVVLLVVLSMALPGSADVWVNGGGKLLVEAGTNHSISGGTYCSLGLEMNDWIILSGTYDAWKSGAINTDNGLVSMTVVSDEWMKKIRSGVYLTLGGGIGKTDTSGLNFGKLADIGMYCNASQKCRFYLGGTWSSVAGVTAYAIKLTVSLKAPLK